MGCIVRGLTKLRQTDRLTSCAFTNVLPFSFHPKCFTGRDNFSRLNVRKQPFCLLYIKLEKNDDTTNIIIIIIIITIVILLQANILPDHTYIFPDRNTTSSEYLFLTNAKPAPVKTGFFSLL